MLQIFISDQYPKCLQRIVLFNLTHMTSIIDPMAISVEILRMDSGCSLKKEFTTLIILYLMSL